MMAPHAAHATGHLFADAEWELVNARLGRHAQCVQPSDAGARARKPQPEPPLGAPTTPFPHRRSVPYADQLPPAPETLAAPPWPQPSPASTQPEPSPAASLHPATTTSLHSASAAPTASLRSALSPHTSIHVVDFAPDAALDRLRRGRLVPVYLARGARRYVLHVRADARARLFPECGLLLELEAGAYDAELVVLLSALEPPAPARWSVAPRRPKPSPLPSVPPVQARGGWPGGTLGGGGGWGKEGLGRRVRVERTVASEDTAYLLPVPGPGFLNWLLAQLADVLHAQPSMRVTLVGVDAWDPAWIRPHWAGAIAEDLLGASVQEAQARSAMFWHLHSGLKQAGRSQHGWSRGEVRAAREERVRYVSWGAWQRELEGE